MDWSTCDLSDEHGDAVRVLPTSLRHFGGLQRFSGEVATVRCPDDNTFLRELANSEGKGRVILVDGGGSTRCALFGDKIAAEAIEHGWAGLVIWGCVRDTATLAELDLGVVALGATPRRSRKDRDGETGTPVLIGGVRCRPGDVLYADEDGVVVLDPSLG
ncbi:MAG TPA: ribonuclease E activity regulator RraA [Gaiellaceae bacterium]|nr:ribonuclease E activity regulator RraA [Gaiellaceae bacterium]